MIEHCKASIARWKPNTVEERDGIKMGVEGDKTKKWFFDRRGRRRERERDCLFSSVFFTADSSIGRCALEWREESGKEGNEGTKEAKRKRVSTR